MTRYTFYISMRVYLRRRQMDRSGRVFSLLCPSEFQTCFLAWVQSISEVSDGEIIAIDGKMVDAPVVARARHTLDLADIEY